MYMSDVSSNFGSDILRDLKGARILITGLTTSQGVDVARAFAELDTRLVLHTNDLSPAMTELIAILSQSSGDLKLYTDKIQTAEQTIMFARDATQAYGGFDSVINLATVAPAEIAALYDDQAVEQSIADKLVSLAHLTQVIANRMRLVCSQGSILNAMTMPYAATPRESAYAAMLRTALAAMSKKEAHQWEEHGIRINAVGPRVTADETTGSAITNEADLTALALHLASRRGRDLSGHVFDFDGLGARSI